MINPKDIDIKDVIYVNYPLEEDQSKTLPRPALIIDKDDSQLKILVVKITKTPPRDSYDYRIVDWAKANLKLESTARASKIQQINYSDIHRKIGTLTDDDFNEIITLVNEFAEAT